MPAPGPREAVPRAYAAGLRRGRAGGTLADAPPGDGPRELLLRLVWVRGYLAGRADAGLPLPPDTIAVELTTPEVERV